MIADVPHFFTKKHRQTQNLCLDQRHVYTCASKAQIILRFVDNAKDQRRNLSQESNYPRIRQHTNISCSETMLYADTQKIPTPLGKPALPENMLDSIQLLTH